MKSIEHEMPCDLKEPLKYEIEIKLLHVVMRKMYKSHLSIMTTRNKEQDETATCFVIKDEDKEEINETGLLSLQSFSIKGCQNTKK